MKTTAGVAQTEKLFRELSPGDTFQLVWKGKRGEYLVTDQSRAAPDSSSPWDYRAAVDLEIGEGIWLAYDQMVSPTDMKAGPV